MIIRCKAYPRAGLIGNPSDGYHGRTISFTFDNFFAEVVLYPSTELELLPGPRDRTVFDGLEGLSESIERYGYYGGLRLVATSAIFPRMSAWPDRARSSPPASAR
jgi:glucuronokinase